MGGVGGGKMEMVGKSNIKIQIEKWTFVTGADLKATKLMIECALWLLRNGSSGAVVRWRFVLGKYSFKAKTR